MNMLLRHCHLWKCRCGIFQRSASTSVAQDIASEASEKAKDVIKQQLEFKIKVPKAKSWSDTAVLHTLANTVESEVNIPYQHLESPHFWFYGPFTEEKRHALRMHGRSTANFVIDQYNSVFQHDFNAPSIDPWINLEGEEIPTIELLDQHTDTEKDGIEKEETVDNEYDAIENMKKFLSKEKVHPAVRMFIRLSQEKAEIPQEIINHFLGFCAFYKGSYAVKVKLDKDATNVLSTKSEGRGPSDGSTHVTQVYQSIPSSNVDQLSTKILSYSNSTSVDCTTVVSIYKDEVKEDMKLDVSVYNHVLLCLRDAELMNLRNIKKEIIDAMKKHGVKPNYETFVNYLNYIQTEFTKSAQALLNYYSQVLLEMKELGLEPGLGLFAAMMASASKLPRPDIIPALNAILDFMDGKQFQYQHFTDIPAFYRMMTFCRRDLKLVKKLMNISQLGTNNLLLHSNHIKSYGFYIHFMMAVIAGDTIENLFYHLQKLVPAKMNLDFGTRSKIVQRIHSEKRPEYLPIIFIHFPPYQYYTILESWLNVAISLLDCADDSTKIQFKHIAMIELNNCGKQHNEPEFNTIINLCFKLLLLTADKFQDVGSVFESLLTLQTDLQIEESLLIQFKNVGREYNKSVHATQLISKFEKRRSRR